MPFQIVRNDITSMRTDAIVNTANPRPVIGSGTDTAIHAKAGPAMLEARKKIGNIAVGSAAITDAYGLNAKFVIHTVGPVWRGGLFGERKLLRRCYQSALSLALENGCRSIAFPLISTGNYGFPKDQALQIATNTIKEFLMEHEMQVYLVVFNRDAFQLSKALFSSVASYIDENYVQACEQAEYGEPAEQHYRAARLRRDMDLQERQVSSSFSCPIPAAEPKAVSLEDMLRETDAGFTETLLKLIDQTGKKDPEIYSRANVSRQHFSKIRNNPGYKPTKATALAFAIALELDVPQTKDLIGRAGYALTNSSKFDVIIRYFIEQKNYDMMQINATLFEFDQSLLGA